VLNNELNLFIKEEVIEKIENIREQQMSNALRMHCFIVEKRDGKIKEWAVADGMTQTQYFEEEAFSPTVRLESIMLSSLVDACEKSYVKTINIKGAFLKAKVLEDLELIVKLEGYLAEMMHELCPDFVIHEDCFVYLKCVKALYGHIKAARLFCNDLNSSSTHKMGFVRNQCDPCIYNKNTEEGQVTIRTHVDDLKVSSVLMKQLDIVIESLRTIKR
jgi:hypothetical protein